MTYRLGKGIIALAVMIAVLCMLPFALGENYSADTMRLLRYDGNVEILDTTGSPRFVIENVRFASGEVMRTGEASTASVSLDATKIVSLDQNSSVRFEKQDNHIELTLTEGTLFLDVSEKLDENESLDITTSTMTVGIRGTIVVVSAMPADKAANMYGLENQTAKAPDQQVTVFGVLEGKASLTYTDGRTATVNAGQIAVVGEKPELSDIAEMTMENITPFIAEQFENDNTASRVINACPQLFDEYSFPADGDWEYTGKVMIIAQSASKLYDGTPLTRTGDILVYNLPDIFDISAYASGAITNAGTAENPIGSYAIYNKAGENVTGHFNTIETVSGQLVVDPAPMTIWTGSATKSYDGEPLVCEEAGFDLVSGKTQEEPWRNTSLVLSEASGETLYGLAGELLVHGTNPITGETSQIALGAGEKLTVRLSDESNADSITFSVEKVTEDDIPEEVLRLYADNRELLSQACDDAGWDQDKVLERIEQLSGMTGPTIVKDGLTVSVSYAGGLMRELTNARINIDSDITDYNGRALNGEEARFTEVRIDDSVKVTATGSQTEVGESDNTYEIDWGTEDLNNFIIKEDLGTLRVLEPMSGVTVTAASASKVYDGTPLTVEGVEITGLADGFSVIATVEGELIDAGTAASSVTAYQVLDADGEDVTEFYPDITVESGTLTVEPAPLTVTTGSDKKVYDGKSLTNHRASISGFAADESADVSATGSITNAGTANNNYYINWNNASKDNYKIYANYGKLTVEVLKLSIDVDGYAYETYGGGMNIPAPVITYQNGPHAGETVTGTRVRAAEIEYRFQLFTGDSVSVVFTRTENDDHMPEVKTSVTTSGNKSNFALSGNAMEGFPLEVEPAVLTITTGSASKVYDGTALTSNQVTVEGLQNGDSITVTATGSITDAGEAENTYTIDWGEVNPGFYDIEENLGTLTVEKLGVSYDFGGKTIVFPGKDETVLHMGDGKVTITNGPRAGEQVEYSWVGTTLQTHGYRFELYGATFYVHEKFWEKYTEIGTYPLADDAFSVAEGNADNFSFAALNDKLIIEPLQLSVTLSGTTKTYDGEITIPNTVIKYLNGDHAGETVADPDIQVNDDSITLFANLVTGDLLSLDASPCAIDADTYQVTLDSYSFATGIATNYAVTASVSGSIVIEPAEATVTTGSKSRVYDGTELTYNEASITGLVGTDTASVTATGTIKNAGSTPNTYSIDWGTTKEGNYTVTDELGTLTVEKVQLNFVIGDLAMDYRGNLPSSMPYVSVTATAGGEGIARSGRQHNVGTDNNVYATVYFYEYPAGDGFALRVEGFSPDAGTHTLTGHFNGSSSFPNTSTRNYNATITNGTFTVNPIPLTVTTGSASKTYDGEALTKNEASLTGLAAADEGKVTVTATGTITDPGSTANTYEINWGGVSPDNYIITENLGTLTVNVDYSTPITVTAVSATKAYDGTPLVCDQFTVDGLPSYLTCQATVAGDQTNAGTTDNVITGCAIYHGDEDITASLTALTRQNGTLTVAPLRIGIVPTDRSVEYDGNGKWAASTVTYVNGGSAGETLTFYDFGASGSDHLFYYALNTGDTLTVSMPQCGPDKGEYEFTPGCSVSGSEGNYILAAAIGKVTITPAEVTVTTGSASKAYDGYELTKADGAEITGLKGYDTATVTATGSITNVGSAANTYAIAWGSSTSSANYTVTENLGTLTVTTNSTPITITLKPKSKVYDGTALYPDDLDFDYDGLPNDDLWIMLTGTSGSQTDAGTGTGHITGYKIGDSGEKDVTAYFSNVTTVDCALTVDKLVILASVENTIVGWDTGYQFPELYVTYQNGDYSGYYLSIQSTQDSGTTQTRTYSTQTGDTVTVTLQGIDTMNDPGQYSVAAPIISISGNSGNYTLTTSGGCTMTLKLDPSDTGSP